MLYIGAMFNEETKMITKNDVQRQYAMECQKSAEEWALAFARDEAFRWQATWAANRARQAFAALTQIDELLGELGEL